MKDKFVFCVIFLCCIFTGSIFGQTAEQIKEKYGHPIEAYSVSERIWMTPTFTSDGQVCEMRLYPKRISPTTNYLGDKLDYWELKQVLDQLAPPEARGKKTIFSGMMSFSGSTVTAHYNYEKVGFRFLISLSSDLKIEKTGKTETKSAKTKQETLKSVESDEELIVPREVDIATIFWQGRTCAK